MKKIYWLGIALFLHSFYSAQVHALNIALNNVNLVDVEQMQVYQRKTILLNNGRIEAILNSQDAEFSDKYTSIDMNGKYVIPGLIDTHVHHGTVPDDTDRDDITRERLRLLLRGGVTSVRDMGGDVRALASLKRRAEIDVIQSPDMYYSVIIGGEAFFSDPRTAASALGRVPGDTDWMRAVDESSDMDKIMLKALGTGATGIKIYADVSASVVTKLAEAAKRHGLKVWSHAYVGPVRPAELAVAGVETVSHAADFSSHVVEDFYALRRKGVSLSEVQQAASFELNRYDDLFAALKANGTIVDATLTVFDKHRQARGERGELLHKWGTTFTRLAHINGIPVSVGTDSTSDSVGVTYPLVYHEMKLLVEEAGFTPMDALRAATITGAEVIGIEGTHGSVTPGKVANLVVLNSDPTTHIGNISDVAHVIKNGEFVYRGDDERLPFVSAKKAGGMLWMSGQLGNLPSTMTLAGDDIKTQMTQAMKNVGAILQEHDLDYSDVVKCTLMLADINDWPAANEAYRPFFKSFPVRSAFAASGLALDAKVEVECIAAL